MHSGPKSGAARVDDSNFYIGLDGLGIELLLLLSGVSDSIRIYVRQGMGRP